MHLPRVLPAAFLRLDLLTDTSVMADLFDHVSRSPRLASIIAETILKIGPRMVLDLNLQFQGQPISSRYWRCQTCLRIFASWWKYSIMQTILIVSAAVRVLICTVPALRCMLKEPNLFASLYLLWSMEKICRYDTKSTQGDLILHMRVACTFWSGDVRTSHATSWKTGKTTIYD
jgi:hypothetical protein